jgi:hypothetical protein
MDYVNQGVIQSHRPMKTKDYKLPKQYAKRKNPYKEFKHDRNERYDLNETSSKDDGRGSRFTITNISKTEEEAKVPEDPPKGQQRKRSFSQRETNMQIKLDH